MHVDNFKVFADLVESESFSKAARLNGITQSAVSQQLRMIERKLDILILDRSQKGFHLTREGQRLYKAAKDILHEFEKLTSELQELKKVISGTIRIATVYSIGLHELPPYIKWFLQEFPAVNVRIEYRRSNLVYEDVQHNAVDLGLVAFPHKSRQIEVIPFRDDELVVICPPKHPLAQKPEVRLNELSDHSFVSFEPDIPTRKAIDSILRARDLAIDPVMEFDNVETVKRAVEIDAGIAIVPRATVLQEIKQKSLIAINLVGGKYTRPLGILHRKNRSLTPVIRNFIKILQSDLSDPTVKFEKR